MAWLVAMALGCVAAYGFLHEHLFAENLWYAQGRAGLLLYASVFWPIAGALAWFAPRSFDARRLGAAAAVAAVGYAAWWCGVVAPLVVLYLFGSCFLLGRMLARKADPVTTTLVGAAAWMGVAWLALHFPVNTRWVYAAALALPYLASARDFASMRELVGRNGAESGRPAQAWRPAPRQEALAMALLLFVLGAHFLVALKPEISSDGLSMHLALPMAVVRDARWTFDFRHNAWAVQPLGGDTLYAIAAVLGGAQYGEAAARLLNFAFLGAIVALITHEPAREPGKRAVMVLAGALFASTPLVQLVTGSLFIENVWAAYLLAATLALGRYFETGDASELKITGFLAGSAAAVKLIAGAFLVPITILAAVRAVRLRQWRPALITAAVAIVPASLPYAHALAATGNPLFPLENKIFRSPYFDTAESFDDPRFHTPLSWKTPYEVTFRSAKFIEGQGGASGFQYFLLLVPALFILRDTRQRVLLGVAGGAALIILIVLPNLRYLYPALPLLSIVIANLITETPLAGAAVFTGVIALNLWFLPASGWYDNEFALFRKDAVRPYLEKMAPVRLLIEQLNRNDHMNHTRGEPVALFSTDAIAGLDAIAYSDTWHSELYWNRVRWVARPEQIAAVFGELGIRRAIMPVSREAGTPQLHDFMERWLDPDGPSIGPLGVFRVRETPREVPEGTLPFGAGTYDDMLDGIEHSGTWIFDRQFQQATNGTLTYSDKAGDFLRFRFSGSRIVYIYTQAFNRGIAQILIDGVERARLNEYAPQIVWQASSEIRGLALGTHTFELRVAGEKDPRSSGRFIDLDGFTVFE